MILRAFSVHDVRADIFNVPFFKRSIGEAIRDFTELANDEQSLVSKYPSDYRLLVVGSFNDQDGSFVTEQPTNLGFASDFKRAQVAQLALPAEVANG